MCWPMHQVSECATGVSSNNSTQVKLNMFLQNIRGWCIEVISLFFFLIHFFILFLFFHSYLIHFEPG